MPLLSLYSVFNVRNLGLAVAASITILIGHTATAKGEIRPNLVPDTMPNAIRVKLDNIELCNKRNDERAKLTPPLPDLTCIGNTLDPTTYSMDGYTTGVLKSEVGPIPGITVWHVEALKAMAVTIRSYVWTHGTVRNDGTLETGSTTSVQTFFPEKPTSQAYQNAVTDTSGQYLSHSSKGLGASRVINALHSKDHGPNAPAPYYT